MQDAPAKGKAKVGAPMEAQSPAKLTAVSGRLPGNVSKPLPFDPIAEAGAQWELRWGPGPVPSMRAVTSIMRVQQILLARLNTMLKPYGLTFPRYEALM